MRQIWVSLLGLAALLLAATVSADTAAGGTKTAAVTGCKGGSGVETAVTGNYRFALRVTMPETMYTRAQVKRMHPKNGEVMLRGSMMDPGMSMGGSMRHLEVQICSRKTGSVVTDANPAIVLVDESSNMTTKVPVAVMEGIGEGVADLHYGNNVAMTAGHRFTIKVTLKGDRAVFHVRLPKKT